MKYIVYVIRSEEGRHYIGFTSDIENRLNQHNSGMSRWTRQYKNWELVYAKNFENITDARKWELHLKKQKGGNGFKKEIGIV
jgi:putative endonuclease